jgi:hypothetical protein
MKRQEWAEKLCKGCLAAIPEKEREACMQNVQRIFESSPNDKKTCCQGSCGGTAKK